MHLSVDLPTCLISCFAGLFCFTNVYQALKKMLSDMGSKGKFVLACYESDGKLEEATRRKLTELIVSQELLKDVNARYLYLLFIFLGFCSFRS